MISTTSTNRAAHIVEDRRGEVIKRAEPFFTKQVFVPEKHEYAVAMDQRPEQTKPYRNDESEPVVDVKDFYNLDGQVWVSVNRYNALVLNSKNMLIADIDFGDDRLNKYAGAKGCDEVIRNLADLPRLDSEFAPFDAPAFADQSYRVYLTRRGCRVICTSWCFPHESMGWLAERFLRFLRSDPQYIELCNIQQCYRARLTPKPWRDVGVPCHVCRLFDVHGEGTAHPDLEEQLRLHDEMTLDDEVGSISA